MNRIPKTIKRLIRYVLRATGLVYIIGIILSKKTFSDEKKNYIFIYQGIGDILVARGYLEEYLKKKNISADDTCLVFTNSNKQIYGMYSDNYQKKIISPLTNKFIVMFAFTDIGFRYLYKKDNITIVITGINMKTCWNYMYNIPGMNFMHFIKYGIYNLDDTANFVCPTIEIKDKSHIESYNLEKDKFIILNPYANSLYDEFSNTFWENLAKEFVKKGYRVFTDCGKGDKAVINGTEAMTSSLCEMYEIGKLSKAYIGIRSGMLDLLSLNDCNIIALYPKTKKYHDEYFQAFDINALNRLLDKNEICEQYKVEDESKMVSYLSNMF